MQLIAFGGDLRMNGFLRAARSAGYTCSHVTKEAQLRDLPVHADVAVFPWPRSFSGTKISGSDIEKETLLSSLASCEVIFGGGLNEADYPMAKGTIDPTKDEALLSYNARLTAEGAVAALMSDQQDALLGRTCLITGFGRIAQALTRRLIAMEMFVIVCARSEQQMHLAHQMGAHPVALRQMAGAAAQADIVINTIPARVFGGDSLAQMKPGVRFIELASAPYGADPEQAARMGVAMEIMGGIPGKYAPERAGEALFAALERAIGQREDG